METLAKNAAVLVLLFTTFTNCYSQPKLKVTQADYKKWHTLSGEAISPDGLWSSYKFSYENNVDTMFIKEISGKRNFTFPGASAVEFIKDNNNKAVILFLDGSLQLVHLKTGKSLTFKNTALHKSVEYGKYFCIIQQTESGKQLSILDRNNKLIKKIDDAYDIKIGESGKIAVATTLSLDIYDSQKKFEQTQVTAGIESVYKKLVWSASGNRLAYLVQTTDEKNRAKYTLSVYNTESKKALTLDEDLLNQKDLELYNLAPIFSEFEEQIFFFYTAPENKVLKNEVVEVWDASEKLVFPAERFYGKVEDMAKIALWNTRLNAVTPLATNEHPNAIFTADRKNILVYSNLTNEPQYDMVSLVDYYLVNIHTNVKKLLLPKQSQSPFTIGSAPSGNYINYYKDKNWWVFDIDTEKHTNITQNIPTDFDDEDFNDGGKSTGYPCYGWTNNSKYLILYDKYDIWLVSPDGKDFRRVTKGREDKITYRICTDLYLKNEDLSTVDFIQYHFDLKNGLLLSAHNYEKASGFYKYDQDGKFYKIVFGNAKYSNLRKAQCGDKYIFTMENFDIPPAICSCRVNGGIEKVVVQSNSHYAKYEWGKSELITYVNSKGENLQGALYYPAGYDPGKKYPMIVYIYSKFSQLVHEYSYPTMYYQIGFTPANYINDGYVVLLPDIKYVVGDPGNSIVDCISSAANAVIKKGIVDPEHIGLLGHSYGGYETGYILTRTSMFAAAVAGSSVTDMISSYLTINPEYGSKMDWRFENQQYRMESTPFDNLKGYIENSTVMNASKITTPLLSWAGKEDQSVDWRQSIELHLALRRLQKRNIFLAYPNQGHILTDPAAQYDLTVRIKNWFSYFLKNEPSVLNGI